MAELHIKSLTCVDKQTREALKDRASLRVNGRTVSGPHILGEGKSVALNLRHQFANKVAVTLVEQDRDNADDIVGTVLVDDKMAGEGEKIGRFNEAPHAKYKMTYVVRR